MRTFLSFLLLLALPAASASSALPSAQRRLRATTPADTPINGTRALQNGGPCFSFSDATPLEWTSEQGELRVNGFTFHLKGVSVRSTPPTHPPATHPIHIQWFGFETDVYFPHGLWGATTTDRVFRFLRANGFNAIRIPFSAELALEPGRVVRVAGEPELDNLGHLARLARFVDLAAQHNLLVMLDMHRLRATGGITELWYDGSTPYPRVLEAWYNVMDALVEKWNLFAVDIKNEPHGAATWGAGNPGTDWNRAAEDIANRIYGRYPQWHGLAFVEGVSNPTVRSRGRDPNPTWWGGSLEGVWDAPITLARPEWTRRVVYSPHTYGPDVYDHWVFRDWANFPNNMPGIWQAQFGFAEGVQGQRAVVIGEWGGFYGRGPSGWRDRVWADRLGDWMQERCLADNFYWGVNPNSGDTGGLLEDDWTTSVQPKLALLARIQPQPSLLYWTPPGNAVCLTQGAYGNAACARG